MQFSLNSFNGHLTIELNRCHICEPQLLTIGFQDGLIQFHFSHIVWLMNDEIQDERLVKGQ